MVGAIQQPDQYVLRSVVEIMAKETMHACTDAVRASADERFPRVRIAAAIAQKELGLVSSTITMGTHLFPLCRIAKQCLSRRSSGRAELGNVCRTPCSS